MQIASAARIASRRFGRRSEAYFGVRSDATDSAQRGNRRDVPRDDVDADARNAWVFLLFRRLRSDERTAEKVSVRRWWAFVRWYFINWFANTHSPGQPKDDIGLLKTMTAGSVGGLVLWTVIFPADVIKSRIQVGNLNATMLEVGREIVRKEGPLALYNGLKPTVFRTIPATAVLFVVYEYSKKLMSQLFDAY